MKKKRTQKITIALCVFIVFFSIGFIIVDENYPYIIDFISSILSKFYVLLIIFIVLFMVIKVVPNRRLVKSITSITNITERLYQLESLYQNKKINESTYYNLKANAYFEQGNYDLAHKFNDLWFTTYPPVKRDREKLPVNVKLVYYQYECMICFYTEQYQSMSYWLKHFEESFSTISQNKYLTDSLHLVKAKEAMLQSDFPAANHHLSLVKEKNSKELLTLLRGEYDYLAGDKETAYETFTDLLNSATYFPIRQKAQKNLSIF